MNYKKPAPGLASMRKTFLELLDDLRIHGEAREQLMASHYRDSLTGIHNRAYYMDVTARIPAAACITVHIDIDLFGKVNKNFGHHNGDFVLQSVASEINGSVSRPVVGACAIRTGGEEFVVVLNLESAEANIVNTKAVELLKCLEDVQNRLSETPFLLMPMKGAPDKCVVQGRDNSLRITFSAGIAASIDTADYPSMAAASYHGADMALRHAKRQGRNRIVCNCIEGISALTPSYFRAFQKGQRLRKKTGRKLGIGMERP